MKAKIARRWLNRNIFKVKKYQMEKVKNFYTKYYKKCIKVLRDDMRATKNPASIRVHNRLINKEV